MLKKEINFWFEGTRISFIALDDLFEDSEIERYERNVVTAELCKLATASPPLIVVDQSDPERFYRP